MPKEFIDLSAGISQNGGAGEGLYVFPIERHLRRPVRKPGELSPGAQRFSDFLDKFIRAVENIPTEPVEMKNRLNDAHTATLDTIADKGGDIRSFLENGTVFRQGATWVGETFDV